MRVFLRNWVFLTLITLALVIAFPDSMRQIFGTFNGLGIVPVCIAMMILALLPGRISTSKARYVKATLATSQE
jgi:hypothetical protein